MARFRLVVLIVILIAATINMLVTLGDAYSTAEGSGDNEPPPPPAKLGDHIDTSLADLLNKPRSELTALADELVAKIHVQEKARRSGSLQFTLLPELHLPLVVPVLREARFSAKQGFSLPPYLTEGSKDNDLALHLARYGDTEAALKLTDDAPTRTRIEALQYERTYPVEWTRLAGLLLHAAQLRLAVGEIDGGTEILVLHKQLRSVLDPKAAQSPLGSLLLPLGHKTFALAVTAWRNTNRPDLVEQAQGVLAEWGTAPPRTLPVGPGAACADVARLLGAPAQGRAVVVPAPARALDLLDLPVPADGVQAVIASFDASARLTELLLTYRTRLLETFPEPVHFAHHVEDHGLPNRDEEPVAGLRRRTYELDTAGPAGKAVCEFATVSWSNALGGFARVGAAAAPLDLVLARDFGAVHFDRTFEQNRARVAPEQKGEKLDAKRPAALAQVTNPLKPLKPTSVEVQRAAAADVTMGLTLNYSSEANEPRPLHELAASLWAANGTARIEGVRGEQGTALALVWEDAKTRHALRLPNSDEVAEFEVQDRRGPDEQAGRLAEAQAFDKTERAARFQAGKPLSRLPRFLELEQVHLGMGREQALQNLPVGQAFLKRSLSDGVALTFTGEPVRTLTYVPRQLLIRFADNRVAELRVLYQDGPAAQNANWGRDLLAGLKKQCGAAAELPVTSVVWADLPALKPVPAAYHWQDDVTHISCTVTPTSAEVVLRDCSLQQEAGVPLAALAALPRGPEGCKLGDSSADLGKRWLVNKLDTGENALVLTPARPEPYEVLIVWFENDRAARIVARHSLTRTLQAPSPGQLSQALQEAWFRDIRAIGWPQRRDVLAEAVQGFGWHDDLTRVRIFWQETNDKGPRVFTEWKALK